MMTKGRYGIHGGQYIPETLMHAVIELEKAYEYYKNDPQFNKELQELFHEYANRPSLLYYAEKMTKDLGGAKIYLKREDLNHTGSHKINNVLGQVLLAKKLGKKACACGNRCRPARRGNGNGSCADGYGMYGLYGARRYGAPGLERIPHGTFGGKGSSGGKRHQNP